MGDLRGNINITSKDIDDLLKEASKAYGSKNVDVNNYKKRFKGLHTVQEKQQLFLEIANKYPRAWEFETYKDDPKTESNDVINKRFLDHEKTILPFEMRNSGNEDKIEQYLVSNPKLNIKGKARLMKRLETIDKVRIINDQSKSRSEGVEPFNNRPKLITTPNGGVRLDIHMPKYQTSGNGCWSCTTQMLLQGRGIHNVTQEDIRSFRPDYSDGKLASESKKPPVLDKAFNKGEMQNVIDMGDAALNFAPDTMMRSLNILRLGEAEIVLKKKFTQKEKEDYLNNAVKLIRKQITETIIDTRSPLGISDGGHYITIVGIEGDDILTQSSTNNPADQIVRENINTYFKNILRGKRHVELAWLEDIQLAQNGKTFYNVPSSTLELNPDGTLKMPPALILDDNNREKAEQEYNGFRVRLYAGKEDTDKDRQSRDLLVDGVVKYEQAYFPKKVNADNLRRKARDRKPEEEQQLRQSTTKLLGYDPIEEKVVKETKDDFSISSNRPTLENVEEVSVLKDDALNVSQARLDHEERIKDRVESYVRNASVGRVARTKEIVNSLNTIVGKNANWTPEKEADITNNIGAIVAFKLKESYDAMIPVLRTMGNNKKADELKARYDKIMEGLRNNPDNDLRGENGKKYRGWKEGEGIVIGDGKIKITHAFSRNEELYDAVNLLASISDSISIGVDLKQTKVNNTSVTYNPSPLSRCVESIQEIASYDNGNYLKACAENPKLYEMMKSTTKLPTTDMKVLNTPYKKSSNMMKSYLKMGLGASTMLTGEYDLQKYIFSKFLLLHYLFQYYLYYHLQKQ